MTIDNGKPTPEAQLQSFYDRFDPKHQKFIRSVQATVRPELVEGSDEMKIDLCHQRAPWPRGARYSASLGAVTALALKLSQTPPVIVESKQRFAASRFDSGLGK